MSSLGTERAYLLAMKAYKLALAQSPRDEAECARLEADATAAYETHQDYLQAEREDAAREDDELGPSAIGTVGWYE